MKKRILVSILSIIIIGLMLISGLFISISNYQHIEDCKNQLKINNKILMESSKSCSNKDLIGLLNKIYEESNIRITYISKDGDVLFDTSNIEHLDSHKNREEVIEAVKNGSGTSVRYSKSIDKNMVYYATRLNNGNILRSSVLIDNISVLNSEYTYYYFISMIAVIIMAMFLATKLIHAIVEPLNELQSITSRIANGDFKIRAKIKSKDEIGQLADTFNDMADKIETLVGDAIEKQNRLEAILKSMDSGVIAVDRNNKVLIMNPYAKDIFGIESDVIGKDILRHNKEIENIFFNNHDGYMEINISYPKERILRVRTADIINKNLMIGAVAVIQDVTDIKRLENMRSEFVANVSHELKTPLTSIKGFSETLTYVNDEETKKRFLDIINDEADRLTRLIDDILTLSNIERGKDDFKEKINVKDEIQLISYFMKNTANAKKIKINLQVNEEAFVNGNRDRFKQMIINLIDNAIKYSSEHSSIWINSICKDGRVYISIKDEGVGISKEHIPRLFERFYRVDKARSRAAGGTGLGLAIVKHILLEFNGDIVIKSEEGKGSEFIIWIPLIAG